MRRILGAYVAVAGLLLACSSTPDAGPAATAFLKAWAAGDVTRAGAATDSPATAASALKGWRSSLQISHPSFVTTAVRTKAKNATALFKGKVTLDGFGDWNYSGQLDLVRLHGKWLVHWSNGVLYPRLAADEHLSRIRTLPERAPILDHNGAPLVATTPVVDVGVVPNRLGDPTAAVDALQKTVGADPTKLRASIAAAKPDAFVLVITLRRPAYDAAKPVLYPIPGIVFQAHDAFLAPTPTFAVPVLGRVGAPTAEVLKSAGSQYLASDQLGLNGLEDVFQRRLAGTAAGRVFIAHGNDSDGPTVMQAPGVTPQPITTTLDVRIQTAAEQALAGVTQPAALVAVEASTGNILAVANTPSDSTYDRALAGRYPPGSSFKVVTSAALLQAGVSLDSTVPCPAKAVIGGKPFTNFEGEAPGAVSFLTDFAHSCNTAFAGLSSKLTGQTLVDTAHLFGIGAKWALPLTASSGQVPVASDAAELAATSIGQGRVLVSPLAMALVAAAAASGTWHPPILVTDPPQKPADQPTTLPAPVVDQLHQLMRAVVTSGTGTAGDVRGSQVFGKTGTAEFGDANPPQTHAWFIGYDADIAFAVLVEGGGVGGQVAAPIAAKFLRAAVSR
ncbi:MAG: penicillin-binding protein [Actinobacteria bacterium]|nr:penicillin-binding protein [Actinomycetota bacterium]